MPHMEGPMMGPIPMVGFINMASLAPTMNSFTKHVVHCSMDFADVLHSRAINTCSAMTCSHSLPHIFFPFRTQMSIDF